MTKVDKVLAIAVALLLALAASERVNALTISGFWDRLRDGAVGTSPVPEPSTAILFVLGLLAASLFATRA